MRGRFQAKCSLCGCTTTKKYAKSHDGKCKTCVTGIAPARLTMERYLQVTLTGKVLHVPACGAIGVLIVSEVDNKPICTVAEVSDDTEIAVFIDLNRGAFVAKKMKDAEAPDVQIFAVPSDLSDSFIPNYD